MTTKMEAGRARTFRANEFMSHPVATPTVKDTSTIDTRALFPRSFGMARDAVCESGDTNFKAGKRRLSET